MEVFPYFQHVELSLFFFLFQFVFAIAALPLVLQYSDTTNF